MVKLDANMFKRYFLLIKETLETKLIGKDRIKSQYGRSFEEAYKLHSIAKNKDNDEIRILYSLNNKYKCNCH